MHLSNVNIVQSRGTLALTLNLFEFGFVKGEDFETYISDYIFPEDKYTLIYKTPGEEDNAERFIESSLFPDFQFEDKKTGKKFWVEAKYRRDSYKDKIMWASEKQLKRYKEYDRALPVFISTHTYTGVCVLKFSKLKNVINDVGKRQ